MNSQRYDQARNVRPEVGMRARAADNVPNLAQVFDVYKTLLQNPGFLTQNGIPNATEAANFINAVRQCC